MSVSLTTWPLRHGMPHSMCDDLLVRVPKPASVVTGEDVAERHPAIGDVLQESPWDPREGWDGLVAAEKSIGAVLCVVVLCHVDNSAQRGVRPGALREVVGQGSGLWGREGRRNAVAREGGVEEIDVASSAAKSPRSRLSALVAGKS